MALPLRSALRSAGRYVIKNPMSMVSVARHALNLRVAVPLDALRWFIEHTPPGKKSPTDVTIAARPPAVHFGATLDLMGSKLRVSAAIKVDELRIDPDERILQRLTPVVNVSALKTEGDFLIVALRATPAGFPRALSAARG